jgi:hypothetical protein
MKMVEKFQRTKKEERKERVRKKEIKTRRKGENEKEIN